MVKILIFFSIFFIVNNSFAAFPGAKTVEASRVEAKESEVKPMIKMIATMSLNDYERITSKKMTFVQRFFFRIQKKRFEKQYKKAEQETSGFNFGGFALGLFLLPLGVLISYIFSHDSNFRKWAWIGFGVSALLLSLLLLAVSSIAFMPG